MQTRDMRASKSILQVQKQLLNSNFLVALFVLSLWLYEISVGVWAFVIGLSQISSFFS